MCGCIRFQGLGSNTQTYIWGECEAFQTNGSGPSRISQRGCQPEGGEWGANLLFGPNLWKTGWERIILIGGARPKFYNVHPPLKEHCRIWMKRVSVWGGGGGFLQTLESISIEVLLR